VAVKLAKKMDTSGGTFLAKIAVHVTYTLYEEDIHYAQRKAPLIKFRSKI